MERLNELEFDGTYVWANQWQTRYVYRIKESDPSQVTRFELPPDVCPGGTPNGIAWDEEEDRLLPHRPEVPRYLEGAIPLAAGGVRPVRSQSPL